MKTKFCLFLAVQCGSLCANVWQPLWSRLKYLNNYRMDIHEFFYRNSLFSEVKSSWLWWSPDLSSSATMRLTYVVLSEMSRQLLVGVLWNLVHKFMFSFHQHPTECRARTSKNPYRCWTRKQTEEMDRRSVHCSGASQKFDLVEQRFDLLEIFVMHRQVLFSSSWLSYCGYQYKFWPTAGLYLFLLLKYVYIVWGE